MSDRMVLLAIFGNSVEAELARAQLEGAGIRAAVMGSTSGDVFAGMGVGLSNVQLLVPEADLERAADLLDANEEEDAEDENEGSTDIKAERAPKKSSTQVRPPLLSPAEDRPAPDESPEATGPTPEEEMPPEEEDEREQPALAWTADEVAARALRSALLGFFTCGLLHFYAIWLLIKLPFTDGELSPAGSRKAVAAMALAIVPGVVFAFLWVGGALGILLSLFRW